MTSDEYKEAIAALGCTGPTSAAGLLGVSVRMARYYASGRPIPLPVAKLIRALLRERERSGGYGDGFEEKRAHGLL